MKFINKSLRGNIKKKDGIIFSGINSQVTKKVTNFYQVAPFPNFNKFQNKQDLTRIIDENPFLKDLKNTIGFNKNFIEVGSGTSQLSLALAIGTNNFIVALDPTKESLELGKNFAEQNNINNVLFFNADIFDDPIKAESFDFVWCSGVLHHTVDSRKGFAIISKWIKPKGMIILGLYNSYGRLRTNFRQVIYKLTGKSKFGEKLVRIMDPYLRKRLNQEKDMAWFRDQYEHPVERKHSLDEVLGWLDENGIEFLGSIPSANCDGSFKAINQMDGNRGSFLERLFAQIAMLFSNLGGEGGLFIIVGRKK